MLEARFEVGFLDHLEAGCLEQLRQVSLSRARKPGFVLDLGIELARRIPADAERPRSTAVIPDAGPDGALPASHRPSSRSAAIGSAIEWTTSCARAASNASSGNGSCSGRALHLDARMAHRREFARPAPHIVHALTSGHICQSSKLRRQQNGVATHEPVLRVSGDREAHVDNLRRGPNQKQAGE